MGMVQMAAPFWQMDSALSAIMDNRKTQSLYYPWCNMEWFNESIVIEIKL